MLNQTIIYLAVIFILLVTMIWQVVYAMLEIRRLTRVNQDLHNRLAARNLQEYAGVTKSLAPLKPDNTDEWSAEEIERARDRIPIN